MSLLKFKIATFVSYIYALESDRILFVGVEIRDAYITIMSRIPESTIPRSNTHVVPCSASSEHTLGNTLGGAPKN